MAQLLKAHAVKPGGPSPGPWAHIVEGETQLPQVVLCPPHTCPDMSMPPPKTNDIKILNYTNSNNSITNRSFVLLSQQTEKVKCLRNF